MSYWEKSSLSIQRVRQLFEGKLDESDYQNSLIHQLDFALHNQGVNFKLIHPLLIQRYSRMSKHHSDTPISAIGLDIETNHKTGEPRLLGFAYPGGEYFKIEYPKLDDFYGVVKSVLDNMGGTQLVTWGNLDIQCLIRLFDPDEIERKFLSRGISGHFKNGDFDASPPIKREMADGNTFFIDHYIAGRSMRIGVVENGHAWSMWIYNLSQFYPGTIEQTAQGLSMKWNTFDRDTHLIDWERYAEREYYYEMCVASNKQDAFIVRDLCLHLQNVFHKVFSVYPKLLVSAGSLADAAASSMMVDDEYNSNSWRFLRNTVWNRNIETVKQAECLLSEAFSAGYVDQFALGYFESIHSADIASAYPAVIRHLPDLRHAELHFGTGDPSKKLREFKQQRTKVFTVIMRGVVTIPETLKYHPITVKTADRQNVRMIGTFGAAYLWEERSFCRQRGAKFKDEEWVIVSLKKNRLSPIAKVSQKLRDLRDAFLAELKEATDDNEKIMLDGMQYMVKVVDNSLYGKTVMTTPIVANINDEPEIVGWRAGDRFNMLYGSVITARTRIKIAEAALAIERNGGKVALTMTDSLYWFGDPNALPGRYWRSKKTAGFYETAETFYDFYLLKTGQYEYSNQPGHKPDCTLPPVPREKPCPDCGLKVSHKMRGLNIPFEKRESTESYYRKVIADYCDGLDPYTHPSEIAIPVNLRKLVTIGNQQLHKLGLVEDSIAEMRPFMLTSKQQERHVFDWRLCIDSHIWLMPITGDGKEDLDTPLEYMRGLYMNNGDWLSKYQKKQILFYIGICVTGKYRLPRRLTEMNYSAIENFFGFDAGWNEAVFR